MQMCSWFKTLVKKLYPLAKARGLFEIFFTFTVALMLKRDRENTKVFYFLTAQNIKRRNHSQEERKFLLEKALFFP